MAKINRNNILSHLVEKQFNIIGLTTLDALFNKNFKEEWSILPAEYEKFKKYSVALLKKVHKCNTNKAKENFEWFWSKFGLKIREKYERLS